MVLSFGWFRFIKFSSPLTTRSIAIGPDAQDMPTDADLEVQSGVSKGMPYAAVYTLAGPGYVRQIKAFSHPLPGMVVLQRYIDWREARVDAASLPASRR